ncbi:MAG: substrate-binding domain-containing protein [Oscillospiraceae bacterium]|nr:substrate-binding domain-containing protein [Oscillospiraceae bacterium]
MSATMEKAVRQHTHSLGILFAEESNRGLTHPFFASVLNAFKIAVEARGYDVCFINRNIGTDAFTYLEYCRYRNLDGVCIACIDYSDPQVAELVKSGIPCVTVDHLFKNIPAVLSDNENGVKKLVEYAISMGHKRIAFIHGHNNSVVTQTRIKQFSQTMQFYKLSVPDDYIRSGLYADIGTTRKLVGELLSLPEKPTCILLPDDVCYFGAQEAAREMGMRIPEDVSVAGYDGISLTQEIRPCLTTIRQNSDGLGKEAAARLIGMIESPKKALCLPVFLPVELLRGDTVSSPV